MHPRVEDPSATRVPCLSVAIAKEMKSVNGQIMSKEEAAETERGDFFASWGGISSVGLGLPILRTEATSRSSSTISILDVVRLCSVNTARQVGLSHQKGALRPEMDADICVFADDETFVVGREQMLFRNKASPYRGRRITGVVRETWVRGAKVFERGARNGGFVGKGVCRVGGYY
jgi:allantoinase